MVSRWVDLEQHPSDSAAFWETQRVRSLAGLIAGAERGGRACSLLVRV